MNRWSCLIFLLPVALWLGTATGEGPAQASLSAQESLSLTLATAASRAAPGVVRIRPAGDESGRRTRSGVLVAPGTVVTCATNLEVTGVDELVVETHEGQAYPARLRGRDLRLRLVLLDVPGLELAPLPPSPGPHPAGTLVLALGTPLAPPGQVTATFGIVSATDRFQGRAYQTDAPHDASNTGGALVDLEGRLVAVLVRVDQRLGSRSGVAFAIPARRIETVLEPLREGKELDVGRLGVVVARGGDRQPGVEVQAVSPRSAAEAAGLQAGDRVVSLAGRPTGDWRAFKDVVADLYAGQQLAVEVVREGQRRTIELTVYPAR